MSDTPYKPSKDVNDFQQASRRAVEIEEVGTSLVQEVLEWRAVYLNDDGHEVGRFVICAGLAVLERARAAVPLGEEDYVSAKMELRTSGSLIQRVLRRFGVTEQFAAAGGRTTGRTLPAARELVFRINRVLGLATLDDRQRNEAIDRPQRFLAEQAKLMMARDTKRLHLRAGNTSQSIIESILNSFIDQRSKRIAVRHLFQASMEISHGYLSIFNTGLPNASTQDEYSILIGDSCISVDVEADSKRISDLGMRFWDGYRVFYAVPASEIARANLIVTAEGDAEAIFCIAVEAIIGFHLDEAADFDHESMPAAVIELVDRYNQLISQVTSDRNLLLDVRIEPAPRLLPEPTD